MYLFNPRLVTGLEVTINAYAAFIKYCRHIHYPKIFFNTHFSDDQNGRYKTSLNKNIQNILITLNLQRKLKIIFRNIRLLLI